MADKNTKLSDDSIERGHETSDINARSVFINGLIVSIGLTAVGLLIAWGAYSVFKSQTAIPGKAPATFVPLDTTALPPLPRLQADPHVTLIPFIMKQESILASYDWVSKDSGFARIPIERAMKLIVERKLPVQNK
jgi:hypothetical protein